MNGDAPTRVAAREHQYQRLIADTEFLDEDLDHPL